MTDHPFEANQRVKVLDAWHRDWTTGTIKFTRDKGAAVETKQGIIIWASYDRIQDTRSDVPRQPPVADLFAPCVPL